MSELRNRNLNANQQQSVLSNACVQGEMDGIKYLITELGTNLHFNNEEPFRKACQFGQLEVVKYLLTSPDIAVHPNIDSSSKGTLAGQSGLEGACNGGHLDIVKYLLTSPDLKKHADLHADEDSPFKHACFKYRFDVVQYLVFEQNINFSDSIKQYLDEFVYRTPEKEAINFIENVKNMFQVRDFNKQLEDELSPDKNLSETNSKKMKI